MTPHKSGGKGTFMLDRRFPGIGRIRRASGTTNTHTFRAIDGMLSALWNAGRLDVLAQIRDLKLHPMTVYSEYRVAGVHGLSTAEDLRPINEHVWQWIATYRCSDVHRANLTTLFRMFLKFAGPDVRLSDLPRALARYRASSSSRTVVFNRTRSALSAYVRDVHGKGHRIWREIREITNLTEPKKAGHPLTPQELAELTAKMRQPYAAMAWTMALTGMGPAEYWGSWEIQADRVRIIGTKRAARVRSVPKVGNLVTPARSFVSFRLLLREVSEGAVAPYDLRRSYANWMEDAEIPRTRRRLYLGHSEKDVTDRYERREISAFLQEDARRLTRFLARAHEQVRAG